MDQKSGPKSRKKLSESSTQKSQQANSTDNENRPRPATSPRVNGHPGGVSQSHDPCPMSYKYVGPGEACPKGLAAKILGSALLIFTVVPYLGFTVPLSDRSDLPWWVDEGIYSLDVNLVNSENLTALKESNLSAIKLENVKINQVDEKAILAINDAGLFIIATVEVMSNENHQDILKRSKKWLETGAKGISVRWPADNGGSLKTFSAELRRLADSYKEHEHDFIFTMVETEVQEERRAALEGGSLLVTAPSLCNAQSGHDLREALESMLANNQGEAKYAWKSCAQGDKAYLLPFLLPGTPLILPSHKHVIHGYSYKSIMQFKKWPSLYWGRYEEVLITENVFSCIRWANGKFHDKFLFIVNVGNVESTNDYSIKLSRFTIPKKGRVVVSTSPKFKQGYIIDVTGLTLAPGDSMLLQIPMFSL